MKVLSKFFFGIHFVFWRASYINDKLTAFDNNRVPDYSLILLHYKILLEKKILLF